MNQKRPFDEVDTDYQEFDFLTEHQSKRQKLLEHDAKEATVKKVEMIIRREFTRELCSKETEIDLIDERINEGRRLLDRLRACIVAQHYSKVLPYTGASSASALPESHSTVIHPAVKKFLGKTICSSPSVNGRPLSLTLADSQDFKAQSIGDRSRLKLADKSNTSANSQVITSHSGTSNEQCRGDRFKIVKKIIVGNVSKYLAPDKKESNDRSTHKWMVYVRGPKEEPPIDEFVEKVCFFLHDSYFPNNVVEITQPPFHLTRRGWGEFQVRVQLHCKGPCRKIFSISHQLKLDRTYTGLQTMGAETMVEIKLDKEIDHTLNDRLGHVLRDPRDSSPRHVAETTHELLQLHFKEENDDDGYEDSAASELVPESRDALHDLAASSSVVCSATMSCNQQLETENTNQSVGKESSDSETSRGGFPHSNVYSGAAGLEVETIPIHSITRSDQPRPTVSRLSLQCESRTGSDGNSGSCGFPMERETHKFAGFSMSTVGSPPGVSVGTVPGKCRKGCGNVQEVETISTEPASFSNVCMEPENSDSIREETVTSNNSCNEPEISFVKSEDCDDMHDGRINTEPDSLCVELEECDNVHEEVVISDTNYTEPVLDYDVSEEPDHSNNIQSDGEVTEEACVESVSCDIVSREPDDLVRDYTDTEPSVDRINQELAVCNDLSEVEPDALGINCTESVVNIEPNASTVSVGSASEARQSVSVVAVEGKAPITENKEQGFFRCRDASGRVFRIPCHLLRSSLPAKTNATVQIRPTTRTNQAVNSTSEISTANKINSAVFGGTPEQLSATSVSGQTVATNQMNATNNRFASCQNTMVNRVTLNSVGSQNAMNVATKVATKVCVLGRGVKSGSGFDAAATVGPGSIEVHDIIGAESSDTVSCVPCTSSGSLPPANSAIQPAQWKSEMKTVTLQKVCGSRSIAQSRVGVVCQMQPTKLASAVPHADMTATQSGLRKTVVVRSVGLSPTQPKVGVGEVSPVNLVRTSGGGTVTFLATKRLRGVAPASSVPSFRVLRPGVSNCVAASPVLPSSAGSVTRPLPSQINPVVRSLPSQVNPGMRSLPSQVNPVVRSLPSQVNPGMRSLSSQVIPVVRSPPTQVNPVQHSVPQSFSECQPKVGSPPVYLLVPSGVKGRQMVVSQNSPRPPVRHVLFVPKGTKVNTSGQNYTSHLQTKNVADIRPVKAASGVAGNQNAGFASSSVGVRLTADSNCKAKAVSILRMPVPQSSPMTSLLKKNLLVQPVAPVALTHSEGQHIGTVTSSNSFSSNAKSSTGGSVALTNPSCLVPHAETLLTTQIGNQTVIVNLDRSENLGQDSSQDNGELKLTGPGLSTPSGVTQENRGPVARSKEKHLMFKSIRESSQKKPVEDVTANINLQDLENVEDLVRSLAKRFPVYGDNVDRSVHPYCASSWNGFLQWNIGKRRASELCRAVAIQKKMRSLLNGIETFHGEAIWSKRRIITWCRRHLYTPLDSEMMGCLRGEDQMEEPSDLPEVFSSLTDYKAVLSRLDIISRTSSMTLDSGNNDGDQDMELDVVTTEESLETKAKVRRSPVRAITGVEVIPPSAEAQFVHEAAAKIGIRLRPVSLDECSGVLSSTVEEMIIAATRAFADELVRTTAATLFKRGRNPLQLDVTSIYEAICQTSRCDFLTDRSLGVQEEEANTS